MRNKRKKHKKVHQVSPLHNKALLAHPDYALGIEVAPFSDPSDAPTDLSSPFQFPYIEMGMVMISK